MEFKFGFINILVYLQQFQNLTVSLFHLFFLIKSHVTQHYKNRNVWLMGIVLLCNWPKSCHVCNILWPFLLLHSWWELSMKHTSENTILRKQQHQKRPGSALKCVHACVHNKRLPNHFFWCYWNKMFKNVLKKTKNKQTNTMILDCCYFLLVD